MLSANLVLAIALAYVAILFAVAFLGDRRARAGRLGWLQSPWVYTLSVSIYCTSWTFYGAVGSAARSGLEFATIYIGPTLVFVGGLAFLRKMVRIGHVHGVTSIADMISSRFGKSPGLAALVTLICVAGTTPYIALQLKALTTSFQVIGNAASPDALSGFPVAATDFRTGFWIAVGMAVFTIIFGTRNIDAKEQHHGVVAAIALEAVVKLVALVAVGLLVVFSITSGPGEIFARAAPGLLESKEIFGARWVAVTFLAAAAIICLPREFQIAVVENANEDHLRTASWLFPLYLFLISLFVIPIAIAGLAILPAGSNPDMFVLTLPMWAGQDSVALLAFLGGFSSATSMVIVACIALSTMLSNHIVMPVARRLRWVSLGASGEVRSFLLKTRRVCIGALLLLGFLYFRLADAPEALASIGLISFTGVAQFLPCLVIGLYWRQATARGALAGLSVGAVLWAYTLFLPTLGGAFVVTPEVVRDGPFGIALLRPQALFGLEGLDPLVHALFWSLTLNVLVFLGVSLATEARPLERLQGALFVDVFRASPEAASGVIRRAATPQDLSIIAQRILGTDEALRFFAQAAHEQGLEGNMPIANDAFIGQLERKLAGNVGAAMARAMIAEVVTLETISLDELMRIADETQRIRVYSRQLEEKSLQLEATARQLGEANQRLTRLDVEKDDFLSQVSHEVRTPMASIRSFSEILLDPRGVDEARAQRYLKIINDECQRLTRLLDNTLDLGLLERGTAQLPLSPIDPEAVLERAVRACEGLAATCGVRLEWGERAGAAAVNAHGDRLAQVFINVISNAIKFNDTPQGWVRISSRRMEGRYEVLVEDNGPGIAAADRARIFSKFQRAATHARAGTGLGLAISGQIMRHLGGSLELLPSEGRGCIFVIAMKQ